VSNIKLISSRGRKSSPRHRAPTTHVAPTTRVAPTATRRATTTARRPKAKRRTGARTAFAIFTILLVGVVALTLSLGFYVKNLDTVFPNVWAEGIELSGLTFEEAKLALIDGGYESNAEGIFATVTFPDGSSFTISGEEIGLSLNADTAARKVYEFGRDGTFLEGEITYLKSLLNKTELSDLSIATLNEEIVREVVREHTKNYNDALIEDAYELSDDSIIVYKGTGIEAADENTVFDLTMATLKNAMEEHAHLNADYYPETATVEEVDLGLLYDMINVEPISSAYDPETHSASESKAGLTFDLIAAKSELNVASIGARIEIPLVIINPELTQEALDELLFRDVLATRTTNIAGTSNRLNNVTLAAQAINGTVLNPGDLFSFNDIVGQRTSSRGYKEAGAYVGGRVVQEIGGGICQTSSTTYDCVLHADLEVVERACHRFTVSYLPLGNDATINWGTIDFKFRNSTDYPLRVDTEVSGRNLTVSLIGTKLDDTYIKIDYELISKTPYQVIRKEDPSVPPGQTIVDTTGYNGHVVDTYKYLYDGNDNLISKTLVGRSTYRVQDRVILIPPGSAEDPGAQQQPSPTPSPTPDPTKPTGGPTPGPTDQPDPTPIDQSDPTPKPVDPEQGPTDPPVEPPTTDIFIEEPSDASRQEPD